MDVSRYIKHSYIIIKGNLTAIQVEMMVVEVEAHMVSQWQCIYQNPSSGGHNGHYDAQGGGGGHPPDDPYGTAFKISWSSEME